MPIDKIKLPDNSTQDIHDKRVSGIDSTPTSGSGNLVTSGGVKTAVDAKQDTLVSGTNIKTINNQSLLGSGNLDLSSLTEITWAELKDLRDGGNLIPGMQYRITDYVTTTAQADTQSAGHPFDVIVTADSEDTLNENARACLHEGDTYFSAAGAKLESWELKYCLDNDITRFAWAKHNPCIDTVNGSSYSHEELELLYHYSQFDGADAGQPSEYYYAWGCVADFEDGDSANFVYSKSLMVKVGDVVYNAGPCEEDVITRINYLQQRNGTGVIYHMKDEWNNECPYDFKNIQFKRSISLSQGYPTYDRDYGTESWVYTFTATSYNIENDEWSGLKDGSLESPYGHESDEEGTTFHDNIIGRYISIFDAGDEDYLKCGRLQLNNNVFLGSWEEVGSSQDSYPYYYANCCFNNIIGNNCYNNTFGRKCSYNAFGNHCYSNTFFDNCYSNTFGDNCDSNTFGYACYSNTFGSGCYSNTFGSGCYSNTFGSGCHNNTFRNECENNTFGNGCSYNTFGDRCYNDTFGSGCSYIKTGNSGTLRGYYSYIIVDNGNHHIYLYCSSTTSVSNNYRNVHIGLGVNNTSTWKTITDANVNQTFQTEYLPKNSQTISV